jgi:predicted tellurium resistance membrane protein TerC
MVGFIEITPWHWAGFILCVLVFIGMKMLLDPYGHASKWFQTEIPTGVLLLVVAAMLLIFIILSVTAAWREKKAVQ